MSGYCRQIVDEQNEQNKISSILSPLKNIKTISCSDPTNGTPKTFILA